MFLRYKVDLIMLFVFQGVEFVLVLKVSKMCMMHQQTLREYVE